MSCHVMQPCLNLGFGLISVLCMRVHIRVFVRVCP